eukprot:2981662-Karenia_brevis.AAC.1
MREGWSAPLEDQRSAARPWCEHEHAKKHHVDEWLNWCWHTHTHWPCQYPMANSGPDIAGPVALAVPEAVAVTLPPLL